MPDTAAPVSRPDMTTAPDTLRIAYLIGAQKAGTTWLHDQLSRHPDLHFPDFKEMHYFDVVSGVEGKSMQASRMRKLQQRLGKLTGDDLADGTKAFRQAQRFFRLFSIFDGSEGHATYLRYMADGQGDAAWACDFTPAYALLRAETYAEMAALRPSKFIYIMRDPVARRWSEVRMMTGRRHQGPGYEEVCNKAVLEQVAAGKVGVKRDAYLRTIERLESTVPGADILYLFFEDLFTDATLARVCDFLGIERVTVANDAVPVNEGRKAKLTAEAEAALVSALRPQYDGICDRFGDHVPARWHDRFSGKDA